MFHSGPPILQVMQGCSGVGIIRLIYSSCCVVQSGVLAVIPEESCLHAL